MTTQQTVNLCGSIAALSGSLLFVTVYTIVARWWRSRIGRLLVVKALTVSALMVVSLAAYAVDSGVLLLARGLLAAWFGVMMAYQAWIAGCTQLKDDNGKDR